MVKFQILNSSFLSLHTLDGILTTVKNKEKIAAKRRDKNLQKKIQNFKINKKGLEVLLNANVKVLVKRIETPKKNDNEKLKKEVSILQRRCDENGGKNRM